MLEFIKGLIIALFVLFIILIFSLAFGILGTGCEWLGKAKTVALQEVDPSYLLKKYEWFKDASSTLDKKMADIAVFQRRIDSFKKDYEGVPRIKWPRDERESLSLRESEVAGIKASFNQVAAEYNSQMSKINWRFCNIGDLPRGATEPLPREYKQYEES